MAITFDTILTQEVYEVPDCFKAHTGINYRYVDVYSSDIIIAHLALGLMDEICLMHCVMEEWSAKTFKAFKTGCFSVVVPGLKELGVERIVAINGDKEGKDIKKWAKFIKMFYFSEPIKILYSEMEI